MRIDDVGTIEFLRVITRIIEDSVQIRGNGEHDKLHQIFTARDISMVLYGLQGLRSVCAGT